MNEKNYKRGKVLSLVIIAILPAIFPFGGRDYYLFPYIPSFIDTTDGTFAPWVMVFAFVWITIIWLWYGYLSGRWFGSSKKGFILCNIPVIVNAISEVVYYTFLNYTSEDHPVIAYWIGSHIDKMNALPFCGFGKGFVIFTILISMLYYFFLFRLGCRTALSGKNRGYNF